MSEEIKVKEKGKSVFFSVALAESILAVILIVAVLTTKFFFKKPYASIRKWYIENMTIDISISEIIEEAKNEI